MSCLAAACTPKPPWQSRFNKEIYALDAQYINRTGATCKIRSLYIPFAKQMFIHTFCEANWSKMDFLHSHILFACAVCVSCGSSRSSRASSSRTSKPLPRRHNAPKTHEHCALLVLFLFFYDGVTVEVGNVATFNGPHIHGELTEIESAPCPPPRRGECGVRHCHFSRKCGCGGWEGAGFLRRG